jgi:uncharacterized membrane protein
LRHPIEAASEGTAGLIAVFDFSPTRTLQQDVEFGVRQIVDVALKAISPAVSDPATVIHFVDPLSRILILFASREPLEELLYDPSGVVRASIGAGHFERLVEAAFEQIHIYSKTDVPVSLRLGDISPSSPDPEFRRILIKHGMRTVAGYAERLAKRS